MRKGICAFALLLCCGWAGAMDLDGMDTISDPDMLQEVQQAQEKNLEAALARGGKNAMAASENIRALIYNARGLVEETLAALKVVLEKTSNPANDSLEDYAEQLDLSGEMLAVKGAEFELRSREAGLRLSVIEAEALLRRRASYRARDRKSDLKVSAKFLKKAKKRASEKVKLDEAQEDLLAAVRVCVTELRNAHVLVKRSVKNLRRRRKGGEGLEHRLQAYEESLDKDLTDLALETRLLENGLLMVRHDEEAWDVSE